MCRSTAIPQATFHCNYSQATPWFSCTLWFCLANGLHVSLLHAIGLLLCVFSFFLVFVTMSVKKLTVMEIESLTFRAIKKGCPMWGKVQSSQYNITQTKLLCYVPMNVCCNNIRTHVCDIKKHRQMQMVKAFLTLSLVFVT